jgi:PIN domain nuclease of toxin-antitoxin system
MALSMKYLLDTHVFIWFREGNSERLGAKCVGTLEAACAAGNVFVSAISFREIGQLTHRQILELPGGARSWLQKAIEAPGISFISLEPWTAFESVVLSGFHRDPWDQMLAVTSIHMGATFVTRDSLILRYARKTHLSVLDARR